MITNLTNAIFLISFPLSAPPATTPPATAPAPPSPPAPPAPPTPPAPPAHSQPETSMLPAFGFSPFCLLTSPEKLKLNI